MNIFCCCTFKSDVVHEKPIKRTKLLNEDQKKKLETESKIKHVSKHVLKNGVKND